MSDEAVGRARGREQHTIDQILSMVNVDAERKAEKKKKNLRNSVERTRGFYEVVVKINVMDNNQRRRGSTRGSGWGAALLVGFVSVATKS